jgi:hypothetical protein
MQPKASLSSRLAAACLFCALALLGAAPAHAQMSDAEVADEIDFARGLASEWGFVDLAERVIERVERQGVSTRMKEELGLLKCDIYAIGALRNPDPASRDELLKQSLDSYEDFIDKNKFSQKKDAAEMAFVSTSYLYARSLAQGLEEAVGEQAEDLSKELTDSLTKAIGLSADLIRSLEVSPDLSDSERRDLYDLLYNRGAMLLLLAQNQEEGTFNFQQAHDSLEKLADVAGEGSPHGLRAFIGIGDVYSAQGEWESAADFYGFVTELAIPSSADDWSEASEGMSPDEKQKRFLFVQLGTAGLVTALANGGKDEEACAQGLRFHNIMNSEGLELVAPYGDLSLLALAQVLVDTGGHVGGNLSNGTVQWYETRAEMQAAHSRTRDQRSALDLALQLAQQVNDSNKGNVLQVRAQKLIAEIITRPGVDVDPSVLAEAAQGKYSDKDYYGAIESYKRVLAALEHQDQMVRADNGAKALHYLGLSLKRLDRNLEAAMVFEEAYDNWRGDPEYDEFNAKGFYDSIRQVRQTIKGDAIVDRLFSKSETAVKETSTGSQAGDIAYREAERVYSDREYESARDLFAKVPDNAQSYEKAIAYQGVCAYQVNDYPAAIGLFKDYLEKFVKDPINATTDQRRLARRLEARSIATFYWGLAQFQIATEKEDQAQPAAPSDWQAVIDVLSGFEDEFTSQDQLSPAAMYRVLIAHQKLEQEQEVDRVYEKMIKRFGESTWTGRASIDIYQILRDEREKILTSDLEKAEKLLRQMARFMQVGNMTSPNPVFSNLRLESRHWMELEEWATAQAVLEGIITRFRNSSNAKEAEDVRTYVIPDLGRAYYEQRKVTEATEILRPIMDDTTQSPSRETAHIYARCLAGWVEVEEAGGRLQIVRIPGTGTQDSDFEQATKLSEQLASGQETWTDDWLVFKFDGLYATLQWGQVDGKKLESVKRLLSAFTQEYGGARFPDLKNKALREKFAWLAQQ